MSVGGVALLADDCTTIYINVTLSAPLLFNEKIKKFANRSRKYWKILHVEASTQITHSFAEAENKTFLLFVNVKQEKYDSSSKQVKIIRFSVFNIWCFP
jgi:tRNA(Leu) C34 or U34 (ribose-2'-O)-methylase TrmL